MGVLDFGKETWSPRSKVTNSDGMLTRSSVRCEYRGGKYKMAKVNVNQARNVCAVCILYKVVSWYTSCILGG